MKIVERPGSAASRPPPCSPRPPAVRPCTAQALRAHLGSRRLHARHHLASQRAPAADYADPEALSTALRGADTLVFVSSDGPVAQVMVHHHNVIRAARASGVAHIVALSGLDADPCSPFCYAVSYGYTEGLLTVSGCLVSIARASIYSEFFTGFLARARASGQVRLPAADGRISLVSRADVARCLAALAVRPAGGHHDITGPQSPAWLPPQLRRHTRGAPRWSMSVSGPRSTGRRWLPPGRTRGGCTRTRRCSPRSGSNAGRQSVMSLEHAGPAAAAARRQPDRR